MARIYGLFTVKSSRFDTVSIMLMQNTSQVIQNMPFGKIERMDFDLKGSDINRYVHVP